MLEGSEYISYREFTKLVYVAVVVDDAFRTVWIASRTQNSAMCLILMRVKLLPYTISRSGNTRMLMTSEPFYASAHWLSAICRSVFDPFVSP